MRFNWDPAKNRTNIRVHGIDFADAVAVFDGPTWERLDDRGDYGEERWVAIGLLDGIEIRVVYTDLLSNPDVERQLISARRATRDERETYHREIRS
ncbi:MAG: BrnT family toxin [Gemmatimonadaceae bacterium]